MNRPLNYKFLFFGTLLILGASLGVFSWLLYGEIGSVDARWVHNLEYETASVCAKADQLFAEFQKKFPGKLDDANEAQKKAWTESASYSQACDENRVELANALMVKYGFEEEENRD